MVALGNGIMVCAGAAKIKGVNASNSATGTLLRTPALPSLRCTSRARYSDAYLQRRYRRRSATSRGNGIWRAYAIGQRRRTSAKAHAALLACTLTQQFFCAAVISASSPRAAHRALAPHERGDLSGVAIRDSCTRIAHLQRWRGAATTPSCGISFGAAFRSFGEKKKEENAYQA